MKDKVLLRYNRTEYRSQKIHAILWRIWRENRLPSPEYLAYLLRWNLLSKQGKLTACGLALAKRHEAKFKAMTPPEGKPGRKPSPETIQKMKEGRLRNAKR